MTRLGAERELTGWGGRRAPGRERLSEDLAAITSDVPLTRGLGRSYGDSALPPPGATEVAGARLADRILELDLAAPRLRAEAGLALRDLVWMLLPRGLFPPVTPGTQFVTLGGMVAADVHGKNHHVAGTVGRHIERLVLRVASGEVVACSRERHPDLFRATLGGMGLTGHILEVDLRLERVPSPWILAETERFPDLDTLLQAMAAAAKGWPFTMAWIDCLQRGASLGRGVLYRGRWATAKEAPAAPPRPRPGPTVPVSMPAFVLSTPAVKAFNELVFRSNPRRARRRVESPEKFFYPLDRIRHWNRIYGRRGFTQFQCVLPEGEHPGAVRRFLEVAARRGGSTFLCVLKDCGEEGEGVLSFPRPGVSVALDLPMRSGTAETVDALAEATLAEGGRIYLAKDSLVRPERFRAMEPRLTEFDR
ncbi:MAG: FAD-binding oxidoreductase, partial [Acidobacteria bacterium]|nr:FAD-binding oxidoreductase [Acidobacteriota bacterium]